ncbi:alpha/beta hydrolase [Meridianimarinicoccus sp. RP-17]|uniref:alpha/beta hydrolase n=1 Tax=Meridianimarinicoccus zhengii TaxID=2056810 RepID=UPI000DAC25D1|nr:cutinase family protein [Phycocomes zhengii]
MTQASHHGATPDSARAVCVFVHGRGQTPEDMVAGILSRLDAPDVHFVLPRAPRGAWYDARAVDPLAEVTAAQLSDALGIVGRAVEDARTTCPGVPVILAGFSQGACVAAEYLMRGGQADALAALTGCRVGAASSGLPRADLRALPVYASCGDADPWIPLWAFHRMLGDLSAAGVRLRADVLPGRPHTVSDAECAELSGLFSAIAVGAPALGGTA